MRITVLMLNLLAVTALAAPPEGELKGITALPNGATRLSLVVRSSNGPVGIGLRDDDGLATAAIVHHMLMQEAQAQLQRGTKMSEVGKQPVRDWIKVKRLMLDSLDRLAKSYEAQARNSRLSHAKRAQFAIAADQLRKNVIKPLEKKTPSYLGLSMTLGKWLNLYSPAHYYTQTQTFRTLDRHVSQTRRLMLKSEAGNPLGQVLNAQDFELNPRPRPAHGNLRGDLGGIVARYYSPPRTRRGRLSEEAVEDGEPTHK